MPPAPAILGARARRSRPIEPRAPGPCRVRALQLRNAARNQLAGAAYRIRAFRARGRPRDIRRRRCAGRPPRARLRSGACAPTRSRRSRGRSASRGDLHCKPLFRRRYDVAVSVNFGRRSLTSSEQTNARRSNRNRWNASCSASPAGIAAYKAAELVRLFVKAGIAVDVVMTQAATHFVTPLTFQALSGRNGPDGPVDVRATKTAWVTSRFRGAPTPSSSLRPPPTSSPSSPTARPTISCRRCASRGNALCS